MNNQQLNEGPLGMNEDQKLISHLHSVYGDLTGIKMPLRFEFIFMWERWVFEGFTEDDLRVCVAYIKRRIKEGKRQRESLMMRNLIANVSNFEEDNGMARAELRVFSNRPNQQKESVLKATGRKTESIKPTESANQILEHDKMAELLKQWKQEQGL